MEEENGVKLWLIKRAKRAGYDEYNGEVVAAETEEDALLMSSTAMYRNYVVSLLGKAVAGTKAGVILTDFHHGWGGR